MARKETKLVPTEEHGRSAQAASNQKYRDRLRSIFRNRSLGVHTQEFDGSEDALSFVAGISNKLKDFMPLAKNIEMFASQKTKFGEAPEKSENVPKLLDSLYEGKFFNTLLDVARKGTQKVKTGSKLIAETIELNEHNNIRFTTTKLRNNVSVASLLDTAVKTKEAITNGGFYATLDSETLGGNNMYGYHEVHGVTELAMSVRKGGQVVDKINVLYGLDDKEYGEWVTKIEALRGKADLTNEEAVNLSRWTKIGHEKTAIDYNSLTYSSFVGDDADGLRDVDTALEGLKRHHEVYKRDQNRKFFGEMRRAVNIMNGVSDYGVMPIVDYNGIGFDAPVISRHLQQHAELSDLSVNIPKGMHMDLFTGVKAITNAMGGNYFINESGANAQDMLLNNRGLGLNTQEAMIRMAFGDVYANNAKAHMADVDQEMVNRLATDPVNGKTVLDRIIDGLTNIKSNSINGVYKGANKQLFKVVESNNYDGFGGGTPLSFTFDPMTRSFKTFNGYEIDRTKGAGKRVREASFKETGFKKDATYALNIIKVGTTEEARKLFGTSDIPEYAMQDMYAIIGTEIYDKDKVANTIGHTSGMNKPIIQLVNGIEKVEGILSNMYAVADLDENVDPFDFEALRTKASWIIDKKVIKHQDATGKKLVGEVGNVVVQTSEQTIDDILERSTDKFITEPTANLMRTLTYSKYETISKGIDHIKNKVGNVVGKDRDVALAKLISQNKPLTLEIQDALQLPYNVSSNQVNNMLYVQNYMDSMRPLLDAIKSEIDAKLPKDNSKSSKARRDYAFQRAYNLAVENMMIKSQATNIDGVARKSSAIDMNYVEFFKSDLFDMNWGDRVGVTSIEDQADVLRVNLNNGRSLLSKLVDEKMGTKYRNDNSNTGYDALLNFMDNVNGMQGYNGVFKKFYKKNANGVAKYKEYQNKDAVVLANDIVKALSDFTTNKRKAKTSFGYLKPISIQDTINPSRLVGASLDASGKINSSILGVISDAVSSTPKVTKMNFEGKELNSSISKIVNQMMMPVSRKDFEKQIAGFSETRRKALLLNYDLTLDAVKEKAADIMKGISNTPLNLYADFSNGRMIMEHNGRQEAFSLPRVMAERGVLHTDIDGVKYAINSAVDATGLKSGKGIRYTTNYGMVVDRVFGQAFSFDRSLNYAMKKGEDPLDKFVSALHAFKKGVRENAAAIEFFNPQAFNMQFEQDINTFARVMPELKSTITKLQKDGKINSSSVKLIEHLFDPERDRYQGIDRMMPTERNAFYVDVLMPVLKHLGAESADSRVNFLSSIANISNKDVHASAGKIGSTSYLIGPMSLYENQNRPPINQFPNMYLYNRDKVAQQLEELGVKAEIGSRITSNETERLVNNVDIGDGTRATGTVSTDFLSIDTNSMRRTIDKTVNNTDVLDKAVAHLPESERAAAKAALAEKLKITNLNEQEVILNPRLHDVMFSKSRLQVISATKNVMLMHENDIITMQQLDSLKKNSLVFEEMDGKIVVRYGKGRFVNEGDILLRTATDASQASAIVAKYSGNFRAGFFNNVGEVVDETTLNSQIKNAKSVSEAQAILEKTYKFAHYTQRQRDEYGAKVFQGTSEKGVANAMKFGVGQFDTGLIEILKAGGFAAEVGITHKSDYFYNTLLPQVRAKLGDDVVKRMQTERYAAGDAMQAIFGNFNAYINQGVSGHGNTALPIKSILGMLYNKDVNKFNEALEIFDIKGASIKNGRIFLPDELNGSRIDINKLVETYASELDMEVKDADGKVIGMRGVSELTHVMDDMGGTHIGRDTEVAIHGRISDLEQKARDIKDNIRNTKDKGLKASLQNDLIEIEARITDEYDKAAALKHTDRGFKYSDRVHMLLNQDKLNDDYIENLREKLGDKEFKDLMADILDDQGNVKADYKNKAVLDPFTSRMRQILLEGDGKFKIGDIRNNSHLKKYAYLAEHFSDNISIEKAELSYAIGAGREAMEFNQGVYGISQRNLKDGLFKFTGATLDELDLDEGGNASSTKAAAKNPYTNNMIVDLGEEFGDKRYLAIGRTVDKNMGEDTIIKKKHVQMMGQLKRMKEHYKGETDSNQKARIMENMLGLIDEYKVQQQVDITGKDGYANDLIQFRMQQSTYGKGAGMAIVRPEGYEAMNKEARVKALTALNSNMLSTAQYNGKSLIENYAEGTYVDAQFRSEKAFRDMGYFDEDYMKQALGKSYIDGNKAQNEELMRQALSTHGDMMLASRFPIIQEGSAKASLVFLGKDLQDNEARVLGYSAASMKLDYDGDKIHVARMSSSTGGSYLDSQLAKQSGQVIDEETRRLVMAGKIAMTSRAVSQNRYFEGVVQESLKKDMGNALSFNDAKKIAESVIIDGKVYANMQVSDFTQEEVQQKLANVQEYMNAADRSLSDDKYNKQVVDLIKAAHVNDVDTADSLIRDYAFVKKAEAIRLEATSKILKTTIGEANVTSYKLRKVFDAVYDRNAKNYTMMGDVFQAVLYEGEEGVISAKKLKGDVVDTVMDRASQWRQSINSILRQKDVAENIDNLSNWMDANIKDNVIKQAELLRESSYVFRHETEDIKNDADQMYKYIKNNFLSGLREFSSNQDIKRFYKTYDFGESLTGVGAERLSNAVLAEANDLLANDALDHLMNSGMLRQGERLTADQLSANRSWSYNTTLVDGREWLKKGEGTAGQEIKNILQSAGEVLGKMTENVSGKTLAVGALGIAAGYMVAGFVGGNPSRPSETQAQEMAEEDFYTIPTLQDQMPMSTPPQQGYVININARTDKGRQQVIQAMNSAMTKSTSTNVNIAMNINDNSGNIDSRYIENMMAGAIQ